MLKYNCRCCCGSFCQKPGKFKSLWRTFGPYLLIFAKYWNRIKYIEDNVSAWTLEYPSMDGVGMLTPKVEDGILSSTYQDHLIFSYFLRTSYTKN